MAKQGMDGFLADIFDGRIWKEWKEQLLVTVQTLNSSLEQGIQN